MEILFQEFLIMLPALAFMLVCHICKIIRPYQIVFCLVVVAGAVADLKLVWDISDTLNGLMSIPNLIALLLLSPVVIKLTREHFAGLRK